jgi:hypothetical protein
MAYLLCILLVATSLLPMSYHKFITADNMSYSIILNVPTERIACLSFKFLIYWEMHSSGLLRGG